MTDKHAGMRPLIAHPITLMGMAHSGTPCPVCSALAPNVLWYSMVMPLPDGVMAPLSRYQGGHICHDCASAETLIGMEILPEFNMARVAVGNDRLESLRLPDGRFFGLVKDGIVRPSRTGDLITLLNWQREMGYPEEEDD